MKKLIMYSTLIAEDEAHGSEGKGRTRPMSGADERSPGAEDNSTPSERTETEQRTLDELKHGQWWA